MNIPERNYVPGAIDPVFKRVVPGEFDPNVNSAENPGIALIDFILFKRAQGSPDALAFEVERMLTGDPLNPIDLMRVDTVIQDFVPQPNGEGIKFLMDMLGMLRGWMGQHSPTLDATTKLLEDPNQQEFHKQLTRITDLIKDGKTPDEIREIQREETRAQMLKEFQPEPAAASAGLLGRLGRTPDEGEGRTEVDSNERGALNHIMEPMFVLIRSAVESIYTGEPEKVKTGLDTLHRVADALRSVVGEAISIEAAVRAEHGRVNPAAARKLAYQRELVAQTDALITLLDVEQTSNEDLITIATAINIGLVEDMYRAHVEHNQLHHGDHSEECHVKRADFDLFRVPYQRIYSTDTTIDNGLIGLSELQAIVMDAVDNVVMLVGVALHPALANPTEDALTAQLQNGGMNRVQTMMAEYAKHNGEFMQNFQLTNMSELQERYGLDRSQLPPGNIGAAIHIEPSVFSPSAEQLLNIRAQVQGNMLSIDDELTIPEDWNEGGAQ